MEATERRMYPFVPTVRPDKPTAENRELRMGEVLRAHFFLEMNRSKKDERSNPCGVETCTKRIIF